MEESLHGGPGMTPGFISGEIRGSGSTLYETVYKVGPDVRLQGALMRTRSDVYAPVLDLTERGYIMPRLLPIESWKEVELALGRLKLLWTSERSNPRTAIPRAQYHEYVMSLECDMRVRRIASLSFQKTMRMLGTPAIQIHGDATIENTVVLAEHKVFWIDPSLRIVPCEVELDAGKLLQSVYGYHEMPIGAAATIKTFLYDQKLNIQLLKYYYATHLVRLWRHQPKHHPWIIQQIEGGRIWTAEEFTSLI